MSPLAIGSERPLFLAHHVWFGSTHAPLEFEFELKRSDVDSMLDTLRRTVARRLRGRKGSERRQ